MRLRHDEIEYNEKYIELFKKVNKFYIVKNFKLKLK